MSAPGMAAPFSAKKRFFFRIQGSQMAFSDFSMKKQIVFGQIWKILKWVKGYSETIKFILMHIAE